MYKQYFKKIKYFFFRVIFTFIKNSSQMFNLFFSNRVNIYHKNKFIFTSRNFGYIVNWRNNTFSTKEISVIKWIDQFKEDEIFLDIGANIGLYSLYAGYKKINVIAIEPHPLNYAVLTSNILDNKMQKNIIALQISAHSENKISKLYMEKLKFGDSNIQFDSVVKGSNFVYSVGMKIDCVLSKLNNFIPSHIKIDVDGNEMEVLKGLEKTLSNKRLKSISIEINDKLEYNNFLLYLNQFSFKEYSDLNIYNDHQWFFLKT